MQGTQPYHGVDEWVNARVAARTALIALGTAASGFFTTTEGLCSSDCDLNRYCAGLQIAPRPPGTACVITVVQAVCDLAVAICETRANRQYGEGGLPQVYVPQSIRRFQLRQRARTPELARDGGRMAM